MSKQNGFTLIEGLLIVLVLSFLGFAGYYVWSQQQETDNTSSSTQNQDEQKVVSEEDSSLENTNNILETEYFTIKLPAGWEQTDAKFSAGEKNYSISNDKGAFIEIAVNPGGFGGGGDAYNTIFEYVNNSVELTRELEYCDPAEDQVGGCKYGDGELYLTYSASTDQNYKGNSYIFFIEDSSGESLELALPMIDIIETIEYK